MRKISKSRIEEDVISSTNGSVNNEVGSSELPEEGLASDKEDERPEPSANGDDDVAAAADDATADADDDEPLKKNTAKKGRKKKERKPKSKKEAEKGEEEEEDEQEYEVEKVIDSKKIKGKLHYLVRWKGYSASSDTWEPEETVSCPDLIAKFEKENSKKPAPAAKKKATKRKSKTESKSPAKKSKKPANSEWDSENADENEEYEVDRILEVHHKKNGKRDFLIHWKGWSTKYDSWEPEEHLNCSDLIQKFMDKVESARSSESKNLRVAPGSTKRFTLQAPSSGRRLSKRRGQKQRIRYDDAE